MDRNPMLQYNQISKGTLSFDVFLPKILSKNCIILVKQSIITSKRLLCAQCDNICKIWKNPNDKLKTEPEDVLMGRNYMYCSKDDKKI
uniref:Uncharacterized protein n=1 Tax=Rhizophagus irregularis (strain DAOM 181602 / DAOM 197198 / MUCL 43194) TaxID=747089 RepID=U9TE02_RHIID